MISNTHTPSYDMSIHNEIRNLESCEKNLIEMAKQGIVNGVDIDVAITDMQKKKISCKEKVVLGIHKNTISEIYINKNGKKVKRYQTRCGNYKPRCSTYEGLINKLYDYYFGSTIITDYSFKKMFESALDEKIRAERPKEKTIRDYHSSYKAFITDEFGAKDIRLIKPSELKEYIQETTYRLAPTKKRFYKFKGILNLTFDYACDPERRYIDISPVPKNNTPYAKNFTPTCTRPEDKAYQPEEIELIRDYLWKRVESYKYDVNGYAILFSSMTGLREGEIPSLKWSDISDNAIHIHSQQNDEIRDGKKVFYYNPTTKNEKGVSNNGRYIPITDNIREVLTSLKNKQKELGIESEWVFAKKNGEWTTTIAYQKSLHLLANNLGLKLKNNHAFRMALNSYYYVPMGLPAAERAKLLGHSVETNLKHYTFARTDDYIDEVRDMMNAYDQKQNSSKENMGHQGHPTILKFNSKEKAFHSVE